MMRKPKIGALFLAGDSWWETGVCTAAQGPYAGFLQKVEMDVAAILDGLYAEYDVVSSGLLHTADQTAAEALRFNHEQVDAILFCPIIWTNDDPVVAFLRQAQKVPLLMWAYDPYGRFQEYYPIEVWLRASGPVSVQQSSNLFKRFGWEFEAVFGNETGKSLRHAVRAFFRAAAAKNSLMGARIALLPCPCQVVMGAWVDAFHLLEKFGVTLDFVSVETFAQYVDEVDSAAAQEYLYWLEEHCRLVDMPSARLLASCKQALAMVRLAGEKHLAGIALEDFNEAFPRLLGWRPHLYHPRLGELGCTVGLEADVPGVLATIIAGRLAGRMGMFNEFYSIDPARNLVLMGHPGMGEWSLGIPETLEVTPDLEIDASQPRGAWLSYRAAPGPMTFLNITPGHGRLKVTAFRGDALPGPRLMEGYAHMLIAPQPDAAELFRKIVRRGLTQHWGTVHGDITAELHYLFEMLELELEVL